MILFKFIKWVKKDKLLLHIHIANQLWSFSKDNNPDNEDKEVEKQVQPLFLGWYEKGRHIKLSFVLLFLKIDLGWVRKKVDKKNMI